MVVVEEKQDPLHPPEQMTSNTVVFFLKHLGEEENKGEVEANASH